jgi:hypothetical protein
MHRSVGRTHAFTLVLALVSAAVVTGVATGSPGTVVADGSNSGTPWIVTVGDSAISGEAGRWAGNTNQSSSKTDAGGADAYFDNATRTAEQIPGCHRSEAAEAHIFGGANSLNLACSGARTYTQTGSNFKPGLDFYNGAAGKGQALMLQEFAATHNVKAVTVLIGANNFGFADIVQQCVVNWLTSPSWWKNYCYDDSSIANRFTASAVAARTNEVAGAILNVAAAMTGAGYASNDYRIIVQTYSSPIPRGAQFRYSESGWTRQSVGGCGVWNRDADWANDTAVVRMNQALTNGAAQTGLANIVVLDNVAVLDGRRLCESGVGLLEEKGIATWQSPGAVDATEWVSQIRTVTTIIGPYQLQEGIHPSYWGQLALRNCLRLAYNGGDVRGGRCVRQSNGLVGGEPIMQLV